MRKPVHRQLEKQQNDTRGAKCNISSLCCRGEEARHNHLSATFTHTACRRPSGGEGEGRKDCWVNRLNTDCARAPEKKQTNKPPNAFKLITSVREQRRSSDGRRHIPAGCYDSTASVLTEGRAGPPHTKPGLKARVTIQDCICSVRPQGMCAF